MLYKSDTFLTTHIRDQINSDLLVGVVVTETANVVSCDVMDD